MDVRAAAPPEGTATPTQGAEWTRTVLPGTDAAGDSDGCFGADKKPDPASGCDFFNLDVSKKLKLSRGTYALRIRAIDASGNIERKARRRGALRNFKTVRVR